MGLSFLFCLGLGRVALAATAPLPVVSALPSFAELGLIGGEADTVLDIDPNAGSGVVVVPGVHDGVERVGSFHWRCLSMRPSNCERSAWRMLGWLLRERRRRPSP